ncbi:hypothetical protein Mevan_0141 [Methanococcus vannielii SB]|uniref:Uncharacterized protein n=1 Tax=Methanococcus vannielii (strain ATCC 35089 / DSM 1224 / JCM 13029 / OCM 148 / SB) TaxID=406327 RepID=A6UNI0_METVS|nr:hypothetical protein [Methanococcus vannielii]ABR54052.1 hypothetical protein Mevan_0141 [Methanococcus vannielii SB]
MEKYLELTLEDIRNIMIEVYSKNWKIDDITEYSGPLTRIDYEDSKRKYIYLGIGGTPDKVCSIYNPNTNKINVFLKSGKPVDTIYDNMDVKIIDLEKYNEII